jgi:hypothetical protein
VVVSESLAQPLLPKPKVVRAVPRAILVTHHDRSAVAALKDQGHRPRSFLWIEPEQIDRLASPYALGAFIQDELKNVRRSLENSGLFAGHAKIHEAVRRIFAAQPARPIKTLEQIAVSADWTARWLKVRWARAQADVDGLPDLKPFLKSVIFLKFLRLWLLGSTAPECARILEVSTRTLRRYCLEFTDRELDEIDRSTLWKDVIPLVHDTIGWLFPGGRRPS